MRERQVPRIAKQLTIFLLGGWNGELMDLSVTGLRLQTDAYLEPDAELHGTLILDDGRPVPLSGRVAWVRPSAAQAAKSEVGVELRNCPDQYLEAVTRYFAESWA